MSHAKPGAKQLGVWPYMSVFCNTDRQLIVFQKMPEIPSTEFDLSKLNTIGEIVSVRCPLFEVTFF